jgi:ribosomal protein L37E
MHAYERYPRNAVILAQRHGQGHYAIATEECADCGCSEVHPIHDFGKAERKEEKHSNRWKPNSFDPPRQASHTEWGI